MKALKIDKHFERRIEKRHACSELIFFATPNRLFEGQLKDYSRNGLFINRRSNHRSGSAPRGSQSKTQGSNFMEK